MINIIVHYGFGNHRMYTDVSNLHVIVEEKQSVFSEALMGQYALTRCQFTMSFSRIGNVKPFTLLEADADGIAIIHVRGN